MQSLLFYPVTIFSRVQHSLNKTVLNSQQQQASFKLKNKCVKVVKIACGAGANSTTNQD
jgi:hypothetical protein